MSAWASLLRRVIGAGAAVCALAVASAAGCIYTSDAGLTPPLTTFYYPTGLAVSPGRSTLYVLNSDFDLQYNGGTVQALDLNQLRPILQTLVDDFGKGKSALDACADVGVLPNGGCEYWPPFTCSNDILNPGPCAPILGATNGPLVKNYATIGAFGSGLLLVERPKPTPTSPGGLRLFVPVRGDPSITFFDVNDDRDPANVVHPTFCKDENFCLDCGGIGVEKRCDDAHKVGEDPFENQRNLILPVEPVGIAASDNGAALVTAHDTEQAASLTTNAPWDTKPTLQFILPNLPAGPNQVASIPVPAYVDFASHGTQPVLYQPGFLITYRAENILDLLRFDPDTESSPVRPFLIRVAEFSVLPNQSGTDSRGIAIDASQRQACEKGCGEEQTVRTANCLTDCITKNDLLVFIANRAPASLLVGQIKTTLDLSDDGPIPTVTGAFDAVTLFDSVPLDLGPSHVEIGEAIDETGKLVKRVFVVCFDSRFIFMYNPYDGMVEAVFHTGRGPQAIAFDSDSSHSFLIVGHFTDSYLGVIDLDMRHPTFGTMFATLGQPLAPRESK